MSNYSNDFSIAIMALENIMGRYKLTPNETFTLIETTRVLKKRIENGRFQENFPS